jgi:hypothetical protein
MALKFVCCVVIEINFLSFKLSMQNIYLFSQQIGMPLANALNCIGYTDIILFLTIGESDIYQHKSSGKTATDF